MPNIATANERTPWQRRQHRLPLPAADCLSVRCVCLLGWSSLLAAACCLMSSPSDYMQIRRCDASAKRSSPYIGKLLPPAYCSRTRTSRNQERQTAVEFYTDLLAPLSVMFLAPTAPDAAALPMPLPNFMLFVFQFSGWKPACNNRAELAGADRVASECMLRVPHACHSLAASCRYNTQHVVLAWRLTPTICLGRHGCSVVS